MHLLAIKARALLHDELRDQGPVPLHRALVTAQVAFQQRFIDPGYDRLVGVFGARVWVVGLSLGPNQIGMCSR